MPIGKGLDDFVILKIQEAYLAGNIRKTYDCALDMIKANLFEADVEQVIMNAYLIEKVMCTTSQKASSSLNTHYVIPGISTKCVKVYCKICSNYHPLTNEFLEWRLTSFTNDSELRS